MAFVPVPCARLCSLAAHPAQGLLPAGLTRPGWTLAARPQGAESRVGKNRAEGDPVVPAAPHAFRPSLPLCAQPTWPHSPVCQASGGRCTPAPLPAPLCGGSTDHHVLRGRFVAPEPAGRSGQNSQGSPPPAEPPSVSRPQGPWFLRTSACSLSPSRYARHRAASRCLLGPWAPLSSAGH